MSYPECQAWRRRSLVIVAELGGRGEKAISCLLTAAVFLDLLRAATLLPTLSPVRTKDPTNGLAAARTIQIDKDAGEVTL